MIKELFLPYLLYIKIAAVAAVLGGVAYTTWSVRGAYAVKEKEQAVTNAVSAIQHKLEDETRLRVVYEKLADDKLEQLLKSISNIRIVHKTITQTVMQERVANPTFYNQPLPDKGYEQWAAARQMAEESLESLLAPSPPADVPPSLLPPMPSASRPRPK